MGVLTVGVVMAASMALAGPAAARGGAVVLTNDDFRFGTYVIDRPGVYRLGEDISFNPNSIEALSGLVGDDPLAAAALGLDLPIDAYQAGVPLRPQLVPGGVDVFSPGGPTDPRYDPAAYGVGFFAAISITADGVVLDLGGHTIEQSAEHALLQRFFAVIELADQPFLSGQGPFDFGHGLDAATDVMIRNGTIGRSSHHGIHGNANRDVTITGVDFVGYEVGAIALNGVQNLEVHHVEATNRKDVPVLGTFSSAQFIKPFVEHLGRRGSAVTLEVEGTALGVDAVRSRLREAINNTHSDLIASPHVVDGTVSIDSVRHPDEYALFHNRHGVVDGNSYSFLVNSLGVAVNGFPSAPDDDSAARNIAFTNVRAIDQVAAINEVPAIDVGGGPAIDPVGAVFQTRNRHPDTNALLTISATDSRYVGNLVANAQALVAKAAAAGEFDGSHLDTSRLSISTTVLDWIEGRSSFAEADITYLCNGDSMFHVNKGAIAFRMDAAIGVELRNTQVVGLENRGAEGSPVCGDYRSDLSHPAATLQGYGGSAARAYTFAGSREVRVVNARIDDLRSRAGSAIGVDVLTDADGVDLVSVRLEDAVAGDVTLASPTPEPVAAGFHIGPDAGEVSIRAGSGSVWDERS